MTAEDGMVSALHNPGDFSIDECHLIAELLLEYKALATRRGADRRETEEISELAGRFDSKRVKAWNRA